MIKVLRMNKTILPGTPTKCFVDIEFYGLIVKGLRVVEGRNGIFVSYPREKGKDNDYHDVCYPADMQVKLEVEKAVLDVYKQWIAGGQSVETLPPEG